IEIESGQQLDLRIVDAAAEVVETLHRRRRGLRGALRRFGNTLGELGWRLEHLTPWLAALATLTSRSRRRELTSLEASVAFTAGWAEQYVRGSHSGSCFDAVTGLGTPTVLRMRLKEIYQHCRAFNITPTDAYCFVIIDCDTDDLAPFERDAVMVTTAGVVTEVFHRGETVIRHRGRVIVLASKSESTRDRAAALARALREAPITRAAEPMVWDDELPASTIELDRHLRELVG
ncbi:MAG: hypothetical protein QOJ74_111, partial [Ilumatobacteraceae bacterium]|nr:hypothetical protein [Ilumatobacteraceae bacterium]